MVVDINPTLDRVNDTVIEYQFIESKFRVLMDEQQQATGVSVGKNATISNYAKANGATMGNQITALADTAKRAWS